MYKFRATVPKFIHYGFPMYVRWHSRKRRSQKFFMGEWLNEEGSDMHWAAILVETVHIDSKPAQRHLAYLGGIVESAITFAAQRRYFWNSVYERLDQLATQITTDDRRRIETAVALKVPRLSREEHEASVADYYSLWPEGGGSPQPPYREPT